MRHNFETAHRPPQLGGKCANPHGQSWWAEVAVTAEALQPDGTVVEFGAYKRALRGWLDDRLDHATMLGAETPLLEGLTQEKCKVFVFDRPPGPADKWAALDPSTLRWPTVENVAILLSRVAPAILAEVSAPRHAYVSRVRVVETAVNAAEWLP